MTLTGEENGRLSKAVRLVETAIRMAGTSATAFDLVTNASTRAWEAMAYAAQVHLPSDHTRATVTRMLEVRATYEADPPLLRPM